MDRWSRRAHRLALVTVVIGVAVAAVWSSMRAAALTTGRTSATLAGRIFTVAGALRWTGPRDESRFATAASFQDPVVAAMPHGGFLIADQNNDRVLRVWPGGRFALVAGGNSGDGPLGDGGPATRASLSLPQGLAALPHGGFLIADTGDDRVRRVWPSGRIRTVAGSGNRKPLGDGGPARKASLSEPGGVAVLPGGGFLIADTNHNRIRRVWPHGRITTVAGTGKGGFSGDGGRATRAKLDEPSAVAVVPHGGFLIADSFNSRIRRVWPDGRITTVAGNGKDGPSGIGGPARSAELGLVDSLAAMSDGGFLIGSDDGTDRVWPDGHISNVVGCCRTGLSGDGGSAARGDLYGPGEQSTVASLPDGGMLLGYGHTVQLVTGSHGAQLLAAAILPLAGLASRHLYQPSIVLTRSAHLTIRIYRRPGGRPLITAHASRPEGDSTVSVRLGKRLQPGLYGVDLFGRNGADVTRAEQWVFLGGSLTTRSTASVENGILNDELDSDPNASVSLGSCHRFNRLRVDCPVTGDFGNYVVAAFLSPQGQLLSRTYKLRRGHRRFELHPRWTGQAIWSDLGAAWDPGVYADCC